MPKSNNEGPSKEREAQLRVGAGGPSAGDADPPTPDVAEEKPQEPRSQFTVTPVKPAGIDAGPRKRYLIGLHLDCPLQSATVGGVNFAKRTTHVVPTEGPQEEQEHPPVPYLGAIVQLTDAQRDKVLEAMARNFVEQRGQKAIRVHVDGPRPQTPLWQPLAQWAYMEEVGDDLIGGRAEVPNQGKANLPAPLYSSTA